MWREQRNKSTKMQELWYSIVQLPENTSGQSKRRGGTQDLGGNCKGPKNPGLRLGYGQNETIYCAGSRDDGTRALALVHQCTDSYCCQRRTQAMDETERQTVFRAAPRWPSHFRSHVNGNNVKQLWRTGGGLQEDVIESSGQKACARAPSDEHNPKTC